MDTPECAEHQQIANSQISHEQSISGNSPTAEQQQIPREQSISGNSPTAEQQQIPREQSISDNSPTAEQQHIPREQSIRDNSPTAEQQQIPREQSISGNSPTAEQQHIPREQSISGNSPTAADVSVPDSTFLSVPNSSFATCKDGFESFHSCISDSSDGPCDQSDLERTVVASTPNKTRPNSSHGHELIESLKSLQGIKPTDSSVDIIMSNPEIPEPSQSYFGPTPEVLKTESSVDVLKDSGEEKLPSESTSSICHREDSSIDILPSSSSINVIGSSENLPDHHIKIRNSLSNDTTVSIRSSVSSIAVLGTSSQSQDFTLPYSLQEGPDSAEDEAFDEVPESSTMADEEEERMDPGALDVCQEIMATSLETVGTEVSQEARSLETIVSPSVPHGIPNQVQCISPVKLVVGSEKDCNPKLNENLEVNLKKSSIQGTDSNSDDLQESQFLKDKPPSANETEENVAPVLTGTEQTSAPATEETEETAAPATEETEETAAPATEETEETAAPATEETEETAAPVTEETRETAAPGTEETEETAAPGTEETEETADPVTEETEETAAPGTEETEETVAPVTEETDETAAPALEELEQTLAPSEESKQATDLNQGDIENFENFSSESSREPEIVRNMYPQVVIKPSLQIAEGDIEVLKIMEPVEYSSSVESTPSSELPTSITSREHKASFIHLRIFLLLVEYFLQYKDPMFSSLQPKDK